MEDMQHMAKTYLDWWENYWDEALLHSSNMDDMQKLWSSIMQTYQEAMKQSVTHPWAL